MKEVEFDFRTLSFSVVVYIYMYMSLKKISLDPIQKTKDIKIYSLLKTYWTMTCICKHIYFTYPYAGSNMSVCCHNYKLCIKLLNRNLCNINIRLMKVANKEVLVFNFSLINVSLSNYIFLAFTFL